MTERCRYCHRRAGNRALLCMNTRDMEERATENDAVCYAALIDAGGGEKGLGPPKPRPQPPSTPDPDAAIARVRAELGRRDTFIDERLRLRAGDVWALLDEIDRLRSICTCLYDALLAARLRREAP